MPLDVTARFNALEEKLPSEDYNFRHFRTTHVVADVRASMARRGIPPGEAAPDFELPTSDGGSLRLRELRGKPVLLHFGSFT